MVTLRPTAKHWKKRTKQLNPPILTQVRDQIMKPKAQRPSLPNTILSKNEWQTVKEKGKKNSNQELPSPVLELRINNMATSSKTDVDSIKDSRDLGQSWQRKEG